MSNFNCVKTEIIKVGFISGKIRPELFYKLKKLRVGNILFKNTYKWPSMTKNGGDI